MRPAGSQGCRRAWGHRPRALEAGHKAIVGTKEGGGEEGQAQRAEGKGQRAAAGTAGTAGTRHP